MFGNMYRREAFVRVLDDRELVDDQPVVHLPGVEVDHADLSTTNATSVVTCSTVTSSTSMR